MDIQIKESFYNLGNGDYKKLIQFILILVSLLLIANALSLISQSNFSLTISTSVFLLVFVSYIGGLIANLKIGFYFCLLIIALSIMINIYYLLKKEWKLFLNFFSPALVVFIVFFLINWQFSKFRLLSAWDEFSHWGLVVKNMYYFNDFGSLDIATTRFKGYPPGTALFQLIWGKLYGSFNEGNLYRSLNVFNFSLLLPLMTLPRTKKNYFNTGIAFIIITIIPVSFLASFYTNTYVDGTLGLLFTYILFLYLTQNKNKITSLNIVLAMSILVLTKASGLGLALIALLIMVIDRFIIHKHDNKKVKKKNMVQTFIEITMIIITNLSWKYHLKITHADVAWNTSQLTLKNILKFMLGKGEEFQYTTYDNFIHMIFSRPYHASVFNMTYFSWVLLALFFIVILLYILKNKENYKSIRFILIASEVGSIIYAVFLLLLYLFTYKPYEAVNLASIERYLNTYIIGLFLLIASVYIHYVDESTPIFTTKTKALGVLLMLVLLFGNVDAYFGNFFTSSLDKGKVAGMRAKYSQIEKSISYIREPDANIYFISQHDSGFDYWVARYLYTPYHINGNFISSIGTKKDESDIWTKDFSKKQWADQLRKDFDYVFIYRKNADFEKRYGTLFENNHVEDNRLYRVKKNKKTIDLQPIMN